MRYISCLVMRGQDGGVSRMQAGAQGSPRYLRVREAAQEYGYSRSFLYQLVQKGAIRVVRVGRTVRIDRQDLETFLESHKTGGRVR